MSDLYSLPKEMLIEIICKLGDTKRLQILEEKEKIFDKAFETINCSIENCKSICYYETRAWENFFVGCKEFKSSEEYCDLCYNRFSPKEFVCSNHFNNDLKCYFCHNSHCPKHNKICNYGEKNIVVCNSCESKNIHM